MSKPILRMPVLISAGLAVLLTALGSRLASGVSGVGLQVSPFQKDLILGQTKPAHQSEGSADGQLSRLTPYTGKLENDVLYYIFVDRFFDGNARNNRPAINAGAGSSVRLRALEQRLSDMSFDQDHRLFGLYFGGDLEGVRQKLPYLADLGVTKIVLSPIQEGAPGFRRLPSADFYLDNGDGSHDRTGRADLLTNYHGYWIRDWFRLDPRMRNGADPDSLLTFRQLLDDASRLNIGVILDLTLHQTSPVADQAGPSAAGEPVNVFPALGEVRRAGKMLANADTNTSWYYPACQIDYGRASVQDLTTCQIDRGLPTLNHSNPDVRNYLLEAATFWLNANPGGAQVAGIRIDAIKHIDAGFIHQLVARVRAVNPDAIIFSENFGGGSQTASTADMLAEIGDISTIDFSFTSSIRYFFSGDRSWTGNRTNLEASSLGDIASQDVASVIPDWFSNPANVLPGIKNSENTFPVNYPPSKSWITSLETHDAPRLRTFRHQMSDSQYAAMIAFHFLARGVPMINYGAEIGLSVPPLPRNSGLNGLGGDPFNRQMMIWPGQPGFNRFLFNTTRTFVRLRRDNPVLRYGNTLWLRPEHDHWWGRPLLMLRSYQPSHYKSINEKAFLYAYSPEGGRYWFRLPRAYPRVYSICDLQTRMCLPGDASKRYSLLLRPDTHRVLEIRFLADSHP